MFLTTTDEAFEARGVKNNEKQIKNKIFFIVNKINYKNKYSTKIYLKKIHYILNKNNKTNI